MRGAAYAGIAAPPGVHTQLVFTPFGRGLAMEGEIFANTGVSGR